MSPQSKGRKRKSSGLRGRDPSPDPTAMVIAPAAQKAIRELEQVSDPLEAELYVSELLGTWWKTFLVDADPEVLFGERLVAHVAKKRRPGALGLLRLIAVLGTERQRELAASGAEALAAKGVAEPAWVPALGAERVTAAWAYGDVYGDQASVLLVVDRGGEEHGVVVLVDHTLGGIAKDAFATDDPAAVLAEFRGDADPTLLVSELSLDAAGALLATAFAATETAPEPEVGEDFRAFRALAAARVRLLPAPVPGPAPTPPDAAAQAALVDEFLASADARDLPPAARGCADLLVEFGCEVDPARPLRVGPALIDRFLDETLNEGPTFTDDEFEALPATLLAWANWAGRRAELPEEAMSELRAAVEDMVGSIEDLGSDGPVPGEIVDAYLADLDLDAMGPEGLPGVLERRMFAMPFVATGIGDEEFPFLDPSDPDDRGMLIEGEHPEYHEALADPDSDTVDDVNPRLHITLHEIVANQLWDDEPPQVWEAAQRLLATGMDRHNVLHAIGEVLVTHLHGLLTGQGDGDIGRYTAELERLGRTPRDGRAGVTPLWPRR